MESCARYCGLLIFKQVVENEFTKHIFVPLVLLEKGLKVRDLNYRYIERLSTLLNPETEKNWKSLAGLMNYNVDFVANLELQPQHATSRLLQDWGVSNDATVYKLYCFLKQLGRDDAAEVLTSPLLHKQTPEYV